MNIIQKRSFRFSQYALQNNGGWCYGISTAILTHLHENIDGVISPNEAYGYTETYARMLKSSYNKVISSITPGFHALRKSIFAIQNDQNNPFKKPGANVYSFDRCGSCVLLVNINSSNLGYGDLFQGRFSFFSEPANHAAVIIWAPNEIFIFDPNCGGVLFTWNGGDSSQSMPIIIDMMLEQMYCLYDRMQGARKANAVSGLILDKLCFGRV